LLLTNSLKKATKARTLSIPGVKKSNTPTPLKYWYFYYQLLKPIDMRSNVGSSKNDKLIHKQLWPIINVYGLAYRSPYESAMERGQNSCGVFSGANGCW